MRRLRIALVTALVTFVPGVVAHAGPIVTEPPPLELRGAADPSYVPAVRLDPPVTVAVAPPPVPGLHGKPFAPADLSDCDEAQFYRVQFGLPARFDALTYRESRCRNDVHTSCCWGYVQLDVRLHLRDPRVAPGYADCGVGAISDVYGDNPLAKQKQMCAAAVLYSVVGFAPWR